MTVADLPDTLEDCHALILHLQGAAESLRETGNVIGVRLGVSGQAGALLAILARSGGRPLSAAQIEQRLPHVNTDRNYVRGVKIVHVIVHTIRKRLGADAVLTNGADQCSAGYSLSGLWLRKVREAAATAAASY